MIARLSLTARLTLLFTLGSVAVLLAWTHRANLQRLRDGNEHRFEKARVLARLWTRPHA